MNFVISVGKLILFLEGVLKEIIVYDTCIWHVLIFLNFQIKQKNLYYYDLVILCSSIDQMSEVMRFAIENGTKIHQELKIDQQDFFIDQVIVM